MADEADPWAKHVKDSHGSSKTRGVSAQICDRKLPDFHAWVEHMAGATHVKGALRLLHSIGKDEFLRNYKEMPLLNPMHLKSGHEKQLIGEIAKLWIDMQENKGTFQKVVGLGKPSPYHTRLCPFGATCNRIDNPMHTSRFAHPEAGQVWKKVCRMGNNCVHRKNADHCKTWAHLGDSHIDADLNTYARKVDCMKTGRQWMSKKEVQRHAEGTAKSLGENADVGTQDFSIDVTEPEEYVPEEPTSPTDSYTAPALSKPSVAPPVSQGRIQPPVTTRSESSQPNKVNAPWMNHRGVSQASANKYGVSQTTANQRGGSQTTHDQYGLSQTSTNQRGGTQTSNNQYGFSQASTNQRGGTQTSTNQYGLSQSSANVRGASQSSTNQQAISQASANQRGASQMASLHGVSQPPSILKSPALSQQTSSPSNFTTSGSATTTDIQGHVPGFPPRTRPKIPPSVHPQAAAALLASTHLSPPMNPAAVAAAAAQMANPNMSSVANVAAAIAAAQLAGSHMIPPPFAISGLDIPPVPMGPPYMGSAHLATRLAASQYAARAQQPLLPGLQGLQVQPPIRPPVFVPPVPAAPVMTPAVQSPVYKTDLLQPWQPDGLSDKPNRTLLPTPTTAPSGPSQFTENSASPLLSTAPWVSTSQRAPLLPTPSAAPQSRPRNTPETYSPYEIGRVDPSEMPAPHPGQKRPFVDDLHSREHAVPAKKVAGPQQEDYSAVNMDLESPSRQPSSNRYGRDAPRDEWRPPAAGSRNTQPYDGTRTDGYWDSRLSGPPTGSGEHQDRYRPNAGQGDDYNIETSSKSDDKLHPSHRTSPYKQDGSAERIHGDERGSRGPHGPDKNHRRTDHPREDDRGSRDQDNHRHDSPKSHGPYGVDRGERQPHSDSKSHGGDRGERHPNPDTRSHDTYRGERDERRPNPDFIRDKGNRRPFTSEKDDKRPDQDDRRPDPQSSRERGNRGPYGSDREERPADPVAPGNRDNRPHRTDKDDRRTDSQSGSSRVNNNSYGQERSDRHRDRSPLHKDSRVSGPPRREDSRSYNSDRGGPVKPDDERRGSSQTNSNPRERERSAEERHRRNSPAGSHHSSQSASRSDRGQPGDRRDDRNHRPQHRDSPRDSRNENRRPGNSRDDRNRTRRPPRRDDHLDDKTYYEEMDRFLEEEEREKSQSRGSNKTSSGHPAGRRLSPREEKAPVEGSPDDYSYRSTVVIEQWQKDKLLNVMPPQYQRDQVEEFYWLLVDNLQILITNFQETEGFSAEELLQAMNDEDKEHVMQIQSMTGVEDMAAAARLIYVLRGMDENIVSILGALDAGLLQSMVASDPRLTSIGFSVTNLFMSLGLSKNTGSSTDNSGHRDCERDHKPRRTSRDRSYEKRPYKHRSRERSPPRKQTSRNRDERQDRNYNKDRPYDRHKQSESSRSSQYDNRNTRHQNRHGDSSYDKGQPNTRGRAY